MEQNKILATVGTNPITEQDVTAAIARYGAQYDNPQGRAMVLEQLISEKLFYLDAIRNLYEREPAFKEQLATVKNAMLADYALKKTINAVKVTEEEAQKYYDDNKEQMVSGKSFNASHILFETEEEANDILGKIHANELTFEDAASRFSKCPSGQNGGSLGDFTSGQMVPEFEHACDAMEISTISAPVKTQFGYHIIRLNAKADAVPMAFADVKNEIMTMLTRQKQQSAMQSRINQLKLLYPVDKNGGTAQPKSSILI